MAKSKGPKTFSRKSARASNDNAGGSKSIPYMMGHASKIGGVFTQPLDLVYHPKPANKPNRPRNRKK